MESALCEKKDKAIKEIWINHERGYQRNGDTSDSDEASISHENLSNLYDLNTDKYNYFNKDVSSHSLKLTQSELIEKLSKFSVVKLEQISIPSSVTLPQHIVNLKQSFMFSASLKPSKQMSTQTSHLNFTDNRLTIADGETSNGLRLGSRRDIFRPSSLPPENIALANLEKRVKADVDPNPRLIGDGDGDKNISGKTWKLRKPRLGNSDLELSDCIPPSPVHCVIIQPKSDRNATPKFNCKKIHRPQTKYVKKRSVSRFHSDVSTESINVKPYLQKGGKIKEQKDLSKKRENLLNFPMTSDPSTESELNVGANYHVKLTNVVDKLQNLDWEICIEGLSTFMNLLSTVDWESEVGQKFIPIISRKLIDFFKSPRSNLCRTACQTAGEFFMTAKSTKRPEFDEMIDILLCRTSDSNRFIQNDASTALDKMAISVCVHHSIRALCAKGPDHKNCVVRASTARLLYQICKHAGIEQIVGSDANVRTRKRVLTNLGKFLMDKNVETRKHAEKLCKMLKRHKFFIEYFFKEIDNNYKLPLRKILNSYDGK